MEIEAVSPLGFVLGKKVAVRRVSARDHDLACLHSAAMYDTSRAIVYRLKLLPTLQELCSPTTFFLFSVVLAHPSPEILSFERFRVHSFTAADVSNIRENHVMLSGMILAVIVLVHHLFPVVLAFPSHTPKLRNSSVHSSVATYVPVHQRQHLV